ncbi:uncharacterized protein VP01_349g13 [Puccinia sorghi]|uniref:Nicotinamide N-methyltransferase n=1 Tax=Puccinia sorghi TaxID=27349 RepID=A0A0L6UVS8_9BASI|nr:uncharacterized protein VP01_349g13 [Puccinia sorghi]
MAAEEYEEVVSGGGLKLKGSDLGKKKKKKKKSSLSTSMLDKEKGKNYAELAKSFIESSASLSKQKLREEGRAMSMEGGKEPSSSTTTTIQDGDDAVTGVKISRVEKTRAEIKFEETQKMRLLEKVKKQALKTHKDRVADFNLRLENQSEHFDIPKEPANFRPPSPEPTLIQHTTCNGTLLQIRLVGAHPLWGHVLYPAAILLSRYIEHHSHHLFPLHQSTTVLELGAGGGLPGLTCVLSGASLVVTTDFPDPDLIKNLQLNADKNLPDSLRHRLIVKGLKWGMKLEDEIVLPKEDEGGRGCSTTVSTSGGFDLILLSDLVFNHSEHHSLLTTCEQSLRATTTPNRPTPSLLVFYSHHRPWCVQADEQFFHIAQQRGWLCSRIIHDQNAGLAFPNDSGDPAIRGTVHGWQLTRS